MIVRTTALFAALWLGAAAALAQGAGDGEPVVAFAGASGIVVEADEAWFAELPTVEREVRYETSRGLSGGVYSGVDLYAALEKAGLLAQGEGNRSLRQSVVATGADGYEILYSVGEIAPDFGARGIMIAFEEDGEPLAADRMPRIVVPGDRRGARQLYAVERITVR